MENADKFSLNTAIAHWQTGLASSPAFRSENIEELEDHLRDSMRAWQTKGLSEEESFLIAARRLGYGSALREEFGKFNAGPVWRARLGWMLAGILAYFITVNFGNLAVLLIMFGGRPFIANGFALGWVGLAGKSLVVLLAIWAGFRCLNGALDGWSRRVLKRPFLCIGLLLLGTLGLNAIVDLGGYLFARGTPVSSLSQFYLVGLMMSQGLQNLVVLGLAIAFVRLCATGVKTVKAGTALSVLLAAFVAAIGTGCSKASAPTLAPTIGPSAGQAPTQIEQSLTLLKSPEKRTEAVEAFMEVDWSKPPFFSPGSILGYTEAQFAALPRAARDAMGKPMTDSVESLNSLIRQVGESAKDAAAKGDKAAATRYYTQMKQCGNALVDPKSLSLLQIVGRSYIKKADAGLAGLEK